MKHSTDRFLVTHVGSLPRPDRLMELAQARQEDRGSDQGYRSLLADSVREVVRKQVELGIDIVDDGEYGKPSFLTYVNQRLSGLERGKPRGSPWAGSRDVQAFPEYYEWAARVGANASSANQFQMVCTAPMTYKGQELLERDLANFRAALDGAGAAEAFVPAISPSNIEEWQKNEYYKTGEEFLFAIADAMREEYKAIVEAGFLLQIDDPRLVTYYNLHPEKSVAECRAWAEVRVEALNHALRGLPEDRIRFHTCYSINMGPRVHDMELKDIVDLILKVRAGAYSFEAANARHEHEWRVWERVKLPEGKVLIPGFITQSSVMVEHPEAVAERILRFASVVGRERVIAGADCGFASFAGNKEVDARVVWAKLGSLAQGARLATEQAWGRSAARL